MIEPRAIDWRLPVVLGVLVVVDQLVALGALGVAPRSAAPLGPRLLAGLLTVVVLSGVLTLARWTWLRTGLARRHASVRMLSVALAVQVGLTISRRVLTAHGALEREAGLPAGEFVFLTGTTIVVLLVLGALLRHRDLTADITRTRERLSAALELSTSGVAEERERLAGQVRALLEARLGLTSMRAALFTPEQLRTIADDVLRPLAHRLTQSPISRADLGAPVRQVARRRGARLLEVLRQLDPMPVLRPGLLAATMGLLVLSLSFAPPPAELLDPASDLAGDVPGELADGGPDLVITVEWTSLLESLGLHAATILVVLFGTRRLARWLARRAERENDVRRTGARLTVGPLFRAWTVTLTALTGLGVLSLTLLRIVFGRPGLTDLPPVTPGVAIGFTAPLILITIVTSVLPAAEGALAGTRARLDAANADLAAATARANALLFHERRLFARQLHATVQPAVNAASLTIERATVDGTLDPHVIARAGASIDAAVERLDEQPSGSEHGIDGASADLDARLDAIVEVWERLADVTFDLDLATRGRLEHDAIARATLCDVLAEACANAIIHGRATDIAVDVELLDTGPSTALSLRVTDDGHATTPQRRDGLGSHILTTSCTTWHLDHHDTGTTLTATLPVR